MPVSVRALVPVAATVALAGAGLPVVRAADDKPVAGAQPPRVTLHHPGGQARVDVLVDGKPFTSYIWPTSLKKPVLYPIRTRRARWSRAASRSTAAGERVDHPHHVGLWFNYGDVNGIDFWNNSDAIPAEQRAEDGHDRPQAT